MAAERAPLVARIREALDAQDADAFAALLADDVTWGDPDFPGACRSKPDVVAVLRAGAAAGATAEVRACEQGTAGICCELSVRWPERGGTALADRRVFHVYRVRDEAIVEILGFEDRTSAAVAAGLVG